MISFFLSFLLLSAQSKIPSFDKNEVRRLMEDPTCCVDIMFLLDSSSSVGHAHWKTVISFLGHLTDPAKDPNAPLFSNRIRVGALQFANAFTGNKHAGDTYLKFPLQKAPLLGLEKWGDYYVGGRTAMRDGAKLALDEMNRVAKPWAVNSNTPCLPENFKQWMVWITDGGPNHPFYKVIPTSVVGEYEKGNDGKPIIDTRYAANHQSICYPRTGESESYSQKIIKSGIQQFLIGVGPRWMENKPFMGCLWGYDYVNNPNHKNWFQNFDKIKDLANFSEMDAKKIWTLDPCNHCNPVDLTIVLDESGSMCDASVPASLAGICPYRPAFDQQIDFVKRLIQDLKATWSEHRVALYVFGSKSRNYFHQKDVGGAKTILTRDDGSTTYAAVNPKGADYVEATLDRLKNEFQEGFTATAIAWMDALGEVEYSDKRLDGRKARQIVLFFTDGGPNTPLYTVVAGSKRTKNCPNSPKGVNGWCITQPRQFDGSNLRVHAFFNQAVCADQGDPQPKWVRYFKSQRKWAINAENLSWPDAIRKLDVTPIVIMVGAVAQEHIQDISCISEAQGSGVGGLIVAGSFGELLSDPKFRAAITSNICGVGSLSDALTRYQSWKKALLSLSSEDIVASWNVFKFIGASSLVGFGAMVILIRRKKNQIYRPLLQSEAEV